jgi:hypothetical protein
LAEDILRVVEESRISGRISGGLNATFIALIPKKTDLIYFGDFRHISLCNLIDKVIAKTIANRIKGGVSTFISKEQFGFLFNWNILDVIGSAQEGLHTIKLKNILAAVTKLDLAKAYDKVN